MGLWGTSVAIDGYSFFQSNYDPLQLAPSAATNPYYPGGKVGAILGGGAMIYNEVKD